jgi:hypothetical protein
LQRLSKFVADLQRLSCLPHPLYSWMNSEKSPISEIDLC